MVTSVNSTNVINQALGTTSKKDLQTLVKYVNREALKEIPDTFTSTVKSGASSAAFFEGIPFLNFLRKRHKISNIVTSGGIEVSVKKSMKAIDKASKTAFKNIFTGKEGSFMSRVGNYLNTANASQKQYTNLREAVKAQHKAYKNLIKKSPKLEESIVNATKKADYFVNPAKADLNAAQEVMAKAQAALEKNPASKKLQKALAKATKNVDKLQRIEQGAKSAGKLGKFGKFMKSSGAGMMLVFSGIIEGLTEVVPTFKELGKEKGIKQIGKSAIKVAGDTFGFIAGQQAGVAVGTAIGTAIFPGVGTAIGAVVGFIGGLAGSWAAGKLTKKITGPSERELAKQQQEQITLNEIANDKSKTEELKNAAIARIQEEAQLNNGELSEDSQIALQVLQNLETSNPFAA